MAFKATSCPEKAPRCSDVNDDDFQSLQAGYQPKTTLRSMGWAFGLPVPQPKNKEIVEDDSSSLDINEVFQF